jgi:serine/threonine protein phosphatase PrpC
MTRTMTRPCSDCGYLNRGTAQFCQVCGAALPTRNPTVPDTQPFALPLAPQPPSAIPSSDTRPLSEASVAFAPLPEGALLHDGRYIVLELCDSSEHLNIYLVEDIVLVRLCSNCRTETFNSQERFCSSCGADLSDIEPLHLRYLVRESVDEQAFATETQLLEMHLEHPALLLPHDTFVEAPYGSPRHYLVEPEFTPPLATALPVPQGLGQVLEWGTSLAQAMDHLHRHYVTLREVSLKQIAMPGKKAHWTHLSAATVIPPEAHSTAESHFAQDVRGLASVLTYLTAGPRQEIPAQMPEQATRAFSQALTGATGLTADAFATAMESALQEIRRPASVTLLIGQRTDVGQARSLNEDSLLTLSICLVYRSTCTPVGLYAVADGMGGHAAGDVASRGAIQTIGQRATSEILLPATGDTSLPDPQEWLAATAETANRKIYDQRKAAGTDMGTTLVMALFVGAAATIANIGDSRAYLLTQDEILQITTDHSLVERLVATGQITKAEAARHPQRNVIYRVVGDRPRTEVDLFKQQLIPGEALLLCSDGLSGMVPDEQIWRIWRTSTSPQEACDRMVEAANQAGGVDNITVVIVQVSH